MEIQHARHLGRRFMQLAANEKPKEASLFQQQQLTSQIKSSSIVVASRSTKDREIVLPYKENVRAGGCLCRGERQLVCAPPPGIAPGRNARERRRTSCLHVARVYMYWNMNQFPFLSAGNVCCKSISLSFFFKTKIRIDSLLGCLTLPRNLCPLLSTRHFLFLACF